MTLNEFKAWIDGYIQAKDELTKEDIKIFQQKLSQVHEEVRWIPISYPIYPIEPYRPYWQDPITCDPLPNYIPPLTTCGC